MSPEIYRQWLEAARVDSHILSMPGNSSLIGLTSRLGYPEIGTWLAILFLIVTVVLVFKRNRILQTDGEPVHTAGIFLSLLASPIAWAGYTILTLPYFLSQKKWSPTTIFAAAVLTVPFNITMQFYYSGRLNFIFWGWWYGLALMICFGDVLFRLGQTTRQAELRS
jgi:hypothetical protein